MTPEGWLEKPLVELCRPKQWPTIGKSQLTRSGYVVFGANGPIGFFSSYTHERPTIAITCRGATCGTVNFTPPRCYITGNAMALDDVDESQVALRYLEQALRHRGLNDVISGSAQPQITREGLRTVELLLPPLWEQKKIAAILTAVDEAIEASRPLGEFLRAGTCAQQANVARRFWTARIARRRIMRLVTQFSARRTFATV